MGHWPAYLNGKYFWKSAVIVLAIGRKKMSFRINL